jgi:dihydrodipicolinate reductase
MAASDRTRVAIIGAKGRMGQALMRLARQDPHLELMAGLDRGDDPAQVIKNCDVLVDFSHHTVAPALGEAAARQGKALVIGTTGHSPEEKNAISGRENPYCLRAEFFHRGQPAFPSHPPGRGGVG